VPRAIGGAAAVIVPSAHARRRVVERTGVDEAKVRVVPWPLPPHGEAARMDLVRARNGIVGQVVLVPAGSDPVSEHLVAVRAMRHLAARHGETTLVLLGGPAGADGPVLAEIRALGLEDRIVRLPAVAEPVRAALFEHAAVVVHLAEDGDFASAALEAMACGVPVVVADTGAAPELVGDHGAVIAPGDDAQLAIEVHRVLDDPEWRRRRVEEGTARARDHTPARVAGQLLTTYRSVMDGL
jgi:glycosyltransferase involved in cell wall biosynthesis